MGGQSTARARTRPIASDGAAGVGAARLALSRGAFAFVVALAAATPGAAHADPGPGRIFSIDPLVDGVSAVALVGTSLLLDSNKRRWTGTNPCDGSRHAPTAEDREAFLALPTDGGLCDPAEVPTIDRWSLSLKWESAERVADSLLLASVTSPLVFSGIDTAAAGVTSARVGDDAAVTFQTLGATYLATVAIKMAVARPRPLTYSARFDKSVRYAGNARMSFPSGHASLSFAAVSVLAVMLAERFGDHPGAVVGITGGYLMATTVATARLLGGKHFLTDVVAGAALGTLLGLTIPLLHTKEREPPGPGTTARSMVGIGGVF